MSFDDHLAERVRDIFAARPDVAEKRMMGGLCFMVGDHMACGIVRDRLLVRVGRAVYADVLRELHVGPMDFTGRALTGFVLVDADGLEDDDALSQWVGRGVALAQTLPPKAATPPRPRSRRGAAGGR